MREFYVTIRDYVTGVRMQYHYSADDFAHAEEQAKQDLPDDTWGIIHIEYDYPTLATQSR